MAGALAQQPCANHPERPGRALCMRCRKVVCQECATQWDGINFCVACLKQQRASSEQTSSTLQYVMLCTAIVLLMAAVNYMMVWAGVFLAENL